MFTAEGWSEHVTPNWVKANLLLPRVDMACHVPTRGYHSQLTGDASGLMVTVPVNCELFVE